MKVKVKLHFKRAQNNSANIVHHNAFYFLFVKVVVHTLLTVGACSQSSRWGIAELRTAPRARWNDVQAPEGSPFLEEVGVKISNMNEYVFQE